MYQERPRLRLPIVYLLVVVLGLLALFWLFGLRAIAKQATAEPAAAQAKQKCSQEGEFKHVPGLGPSCRQVNGIWKVRLKDGSSIETHGQDGAGVALAAEPGAVASSSHVCVTDLANDYYGLILYVYASDQANRYSTVAPTVRTNFHGAQDKLNSEAQEFGVTASYKMACGADGAVRVDGVQLPTPLASTTFSTVVSDLRAKGFNNRRVKYWVWFDGRPPGAACGVGHLYNDDRPSADNLSNGNASSALFGVSFGCNAMMHENGHNLGAVQNTAPNSSGAGHCNDDRDVMCYNDGGPRSGGFRTDVCTDKEHFDCGHNDYFHPAPPSGNYLATHWNIAACYVRYISRSGCGGTLPTATRTRTPTSGGTLPTATRTRTPTSGGTLPTATRTRTATTSTGGATCSPVSATISAPFTQDGTGTFCSQASSIPSYINSWNLTSLKVNGVDFTNLYVSASALPAKINGYWYISYSSSVSWGHFEAR